MAEQGGLNQDQKGARQLEHQGGRREGGGGEEVRFRNLRNQEGTGAAAGVVGGEEVRLRNVKMRQKRARPSAGRPKSEVISIIISSISIIISSSISISISITRRGQGHLLGDLRVR